MTAQITNIKEPGDISNERIVIKVTSNLDIGEYLVLCTEFDDGSITNEVESTYWFPDKRVSEGDLVVLYTKVGREKTKENKSGNNTHFFYWGMANAVWNRRDRAAVLSRAKTWQAFTPDDF